MAVRLDKKLKATIRKEVASYNRKINYYSKKGFLGLPSKVTAKQLYALNSRKSINRELKRMKSLDSKSVDRIVINDNLVTTYEYKKIKGQLSVGKRVLKQRIKNLMDMEYKVFGNKTGIKVKDRIDLNELRERLKYGEIKDDKLISSIRKYERISRITAKDYFSMSDKEKESIGKLLNRIENPFINKKLRGNYLEVLTDLGYSYGYDSKKLAEIEEKISKLTDEEFDKMFSEDIGLKKIFNYYAIMKINLGTNFVDNKEEVFDLYNTLYENIDSMIVR